MKIGITFDPLVNQHEGMTADSTGHLYRKDVLPGAAWFVNGLSGEETISDVMLRFCCPCGCGAIGALPIKKSFDPASWDWDGNREKPTVKPSIQMLTPCRWHGYLTGGVFESC